ncbi:lipopolysaccharide biosynthesis protein [Promicromonospora sp. NPDC060204]|uniref:lipopolysaccharide biosynthesis protein n=1 Tax=Promicromonospora sp. NPDC060204 TaxID=3347071 RepID=UPI00366646C1
MTATAPGPGLGSRAARGGVLTLTGQAFRFLIQAAALVVLARLLSPDDFGMVAMVLVIVGIGELVRDFGLSNAAVQTPSLSRAERDNLFWLSLLLGAVLALAVLALAPLVAALYGQPELRQVTRWLAITFVLNGFAAQFRAGLTRDLRFGAAAVVEVAGPLAGLSTAILMAVGGWGYWALVGQELVKALVLSVGLVVAARWWPGPPRRGTSVRSFVRYGGYLMGTQILGYTSRNIDTLVVGARFGAAVTGLYSRAYQLMALPVTQLSYPTTRVALPVLSRLNDDPDRYRTYLLRGQLLLLHAVVPLFVLTGVLAEPVIRVVLGAQWDEAVPIFQVLAIGGVFDGAALATMWVFLSTGRTRAQLFLALTTRPLMIVAVLVGSHWGVVGVAAGYAVSTALCWPVGLVWIARVTTAPARDLFWNGARAIAVHGCAGALVWWTLGRTNLPDPVVLGLGVLVMAAWFALTCCVWPRLRRDARELWATRRQLARVARPATTRSVVSP